MDTYKLIGRTKLAADLFVIFLKGQCTLIGDRICVINNAHWDELLKSVLNLNYAF